MPEVVTTYLENQKADPLTRFQRVREVQQALLDSYHKDFAKHSGKVNAMHIVSVFENAARQLSRVQDGSVQRFQFKDVIPNRKGFSALSGPIAWLDHAGLLLQVKICNRSEIPLDSFCRDNIFKLYFFDTGLLGCLLRLPLDALMDQNYGITKGYFAENFVAQELRAQGLPLYGWQEGTSEIEFLSLIDGHPVPIEVKSGLRTKARSLSQFLLRYQPKLAIKLSAKSPENQMPGPLRHYPLYYAGFLTRLRKAPNTPPSP